VEGGLLELAKEIEDGTKGKSPDPLDSALAPSKWWDPGIFLKPPEPTPAYKAEQAFDLTIVNLLERITNAPDGKLEPLTTALNAVVQAHDTYTYEEAEND
jgi:hypothetical protein